MLNMHWTNLKKKNNKSLICTILSNLSIVNVPDEGYSRNAPCALHLISTFFSMRIFNSEMVKLWLFILLVVFQNVEIVRLALEAHHHIQQ